MPGPAEQRRVLHLAYVIYAKITRIEWQNHPDGYYVHFEGSWESLNFGLDHPPWSVGDTVKISFQKQEPDHALPSQPPV